MDNDAGPDLVKERPSLVRRGHISDMVERTSKLIACGFTTHDMYGGPCFLFKQSFHNVETDKTAASNNKNSPFSHCVALSSNNKGIASSKRAIQAISVLLRP